MAENLCFCGHVEDEHNARNGTCEVEGCECACFEESDEEPADEDE